MPRQPPARQTSSSSDASNSNSAPIQAASDERKKKHVCQTCNRGFTTSGHLARHGRVHTGERNHKCPFPGCETRCSRQDNLQQHYRVHLSPRSRNISTSAARAAMGRAALEASQAQQQQQLQAQVQVQQQQQRELPTTLALPTLGGPPQHQQQQQPSQLDYASPAPYPSRPLPDYASPAPFARPQSTWRYPTTASAVSHGSPAGSSSSSVPSGPPTPLAEYRAPAPEYANGGESNYRQPSPPPVLPPIQYLPSAGRSASYGGYDGGYGGPPPTYATSTGGGPFESWREEKHHHAPHHHQAHHHHAHHHAHAMHHGGYAA